MNYAPLTIICIQNWLLCNVMPFFGSENYSVQQLKGISALILLFDVCKLFERVDHKEPLKVTKQWSMYFIR